jgi:hypothetical protein
MLTVLNLNNNPVLDASCKTNYTSLTNENKQERRALNRNRGQTPPLKIAVIQKKSRPTEIAANQEEATQESELTTPYS